MLLFVFSLGILFSCDKESLEPQSIVGSWSLIKTELYENGVLQTSHVMDEVITKYHFSACSSEAQVSCDLMIEEDGEMHAHTYSYDANSKLLQIDSASNFLVKELTPVELELTRSYDTYMSTYRFVKG